MKNECFISCVVLSIWLIFEYVLYICYSILNFIINFVTKATKGHITLLIQFVNWLLFPSDNLLDIAE